MHQVMEIGLPVPLGIGVEGQVHPGQLPGQALTIGIERRTGFIRVEHRLIVAVGPFRIGPQQRQHVGRLVPVQDLASPLPVAVRLRGQLRRIGDVEFLVEHRIAGRVLVDVGGPVTDPLPGDEDRQFDVELDLAHLERCGVPVPHQVADQSFVVADRFRALAVGDPGRLHHGRVVPHVVDHADEAVVEHGQRLEQEGLHRRDGRAQGRRGL